jgi:hypothetical protein
MSRPNRKKTDLNQCRIPFRLVGLVAVDVVLAFVFLGLHCRCETLGRELTTLEATGERLQQDLRSEEAKWVQTKSPENIRRALAAIGSAMAWARDEQTVRLYEAEAFYQQLVASARDASAQHRFSVGLGDE